MYYTERVINGVLMYKTDPRHDWRHVDGIKGTAFELMARLSKTQREDIFRALKELDQA